MKEKKITAWAEERNIIKGSTAIKQMDKMVEEVLELRDAVVQTELLVDIIASGGELNIPPELRKKLDDSFERIADGIGDVHVTNVIQSKFWDLKMKDCIDFAYDTIKTRKGRMVNQKWVKESDLTEDQKNDKEIFGL